MDDPMKIAFSEISTPSTGVIAVGVTDDRTLGATARALDERSGGVLSRALARRPLQRQEGDVHHGRRAAWA